MQPDEANDVAGAEVDHRISAVRRDGSIGLLVVADAQPVDRGVEIGEGCRCRRRP